MAFGSNRNLRYYMVFVIILMAAGSTFGQTEICDNGIDDDNDNLIDLNDEDCFCEIINPTSLIPNPSFEEMDCCPDDRSQLDCASDWIQASEPTTDYIHTCGWMGWDDFPPPIPFPDGDGIMGFRDGRVRNGGLEPYWKEYAGACLTSPLLADTLYRFQFDVGFVNDLKSPPIDITFFGTEDCQFLPFGKDDETFGCPSKSPDWKKLADVRVSGGTGNKWVKTFLEITPTEDIYAIAIGPDCSPVPSDVSIYYFFDNLFLTDLASFNLIIKEIEHPCSNNFALSVPYNQNFQYQWYQSGIALAGETFSQLTMNYGEGFYQVRIIDENSCRLSEAFEYVIPVIENQVSTAICLGDTYRFGDLELDAAGIYLDTFPNKDGCDSIVTLELDIVGLTYDTLAVSLFNGEAFTLGNSSFNNTGEYLVTLDSSLGCDSLVLLQLSYFDVYIPNVIAPNTANGNIFKVFVADEEINSINVQIFDRWGNQIFEGQEWDGRDVAIGVYTYLVSIDFKHGISKQFAGDVTVLN